MVVVVVAFEVVLVALVVVVLAALVVEVVFAALVVEVVFAALVVEVVFAALVVAVLLFPAVVVFVLVAAVVVVTEARSSGSLLLSLLWILLKSGSPLWPQFAVEFDDCEVPLLLPAGPGTLGGLLFAAAAFCGPWAAAGAAFWCP